MLDEWGLTYRLHTHAPLRTVEDSKSIEDEILVPGENALRIKNLYLRDRKKRNYLVTLEQDRDIDLKALGADLGVGSLSFGSPDRLMEHLGIRPGAVSPLAMITGATKNVTFYMDACAKQADLINMHPLVNDRTVVMKMTDVMQLMERLNVSVMWLP
jgi:Ala-tRNA(Pro) deacylase